MKSGREDEDGEGEDVTDEVEHAECDQHEQPNGLHAREIEHEAREQPRSWPAAATICSRTSISVSDFTTGSEVVIAKGVYFVLQPGLRFAQCRRKE